MKRLLNLREAADFLNISPLTLRTWTGGRRIPFVKIGRRVLFDPDDLLSFVQSRKVAPRPRRESADEQW